MHLMATYGLMEAARDTSRYMGAAARLIGEGASASLFPNPAAKMLSAWGEVTERSCARMSVKPDWDLPALVDEHGSECAVTPQVDLARPFGDLVHFRVAGRSTPSRKVLLVAPMSGHYATLLRATVVSLLPDADVYITDWQDARMAPVWLGRFDLDDYIDHIRNMLTFLGTGAHVLGVCQPGPPVLAAIAMMAEDDDPARPASMTFMGSPIDTRLSPTVPNVLAEEKPLSWFEENMIHTVPGPYPGMFRRVYPGFVQLASFMNMNWSRHVDAHWNFFNHLVEGDGDNVGKHREFYDEYLSVLDLTEEFYLQTIVRVFQEHQLARGVYRYRGTHVVKPEAIRDVALMTVEGEKDDISGIGQTQAAHAICTSLPEDMQTDYIQPGVGHYGVFNGKRFRTEIAPRVTEFTRRFTMRDADEEAAERLSRLA